ncbi:hypothetical protein [Allorhizobium borbori]|uniref:Uncharacterized protein n=1 Tax=Allorhizobium borbori TaxID=485907 RepID=A0A7W6K1J2_9HYPH|nr:hypothetical protein [Allorhizobium borbori]MBB4102395.1 hypothetical protein [Allorhizobium borbori]
MFNSGSPSSPGVSKAELEFAKAEMISQMITRENLNTAIGRSGWVSLGTLSLSGKNFIDLTNVSSDANELDLALQGVSTTATSSMYARVYGETGSLLSSGYYGYLNNLAGSTLSSVAESPGDAAILAGSLLANGYMSGGIRLRRQLGNTWRIESSVFDAANRSMFSCHVTTAVGVGITGIRLLLGTAGVTWDDGSVTTRWRR